MDSVFDKFDDEEADEQPRKRKLVPLDYDDDKSLGVDGAGLSSIKGANTEEKRKHIKSLIEKIPTAKPELFAYPLDWSMVDTVRKKTLSLHVNTGVQGGLSHNLFSFSDVNGATGAAVDQ